MRSEELGAMFEEATFGILREVFQCWGFQVVESKIQSSGTQHGFDLYFRVVRGRVNHCLFFECKASSSFNEIKYIELRDKIAQLNWAGFPRKDFHIFFSPTRAVDFGNQQLTLEDNLWPFVIIDWMRKESGTNPALELFATYDGNNVDVTRYSEYLFSETAGSFTTSKTFTQVCNELKEHFDRRINEHSDAAEQNAYRIINGTFWSQVQRDTHSEYLHYYYTKTDSSPGRLREAVANDFDVRHEMLEKEFDRILHQAIGERSALIKILSRGGEGKSTFLYRIARTYCSRHTVIWLEDLSSDLLNDIKHNVQRLDTEGALILLLDNAAIYGRELIDFAQKLTTFFRKYPLVLVVAEREFRYLNIEGRESFEATFNETHEIQYRANRLRQPIFDRFITEIQRDYPLPAELLGEANRIFLADLRMSITECIFCVIKYLKEKTGLKGYTFDWEDWERFTKAKAPKLQRLYLVLATFYQFGFSLDAGFSTGFLKDTDEIDINSALGESPNLPIYHRGRHLFLRHETIASWFLDATEEKSRANRSNSELIFKAFLQRIDSETSRDLFIWVCIKNKDFRRSYLAQTVDDQKRTEILENYIRQNKKELKCRTELSKVYQHQKRWKEAEDILLELKTIDPDNLQARTELSKIYQQQKRWKEAEDILLESLSIDSEQLHPRTELSKIYQQQKRWKEAEDILLESLSIDAEQLHPRTELSKIYQHQKRWKEAEDVLIECLEIDSEDLSSLTELSKICQSTGRPEHAEELLLKCLSIKPDDLNSLLEMGKYCSREPSRRKEAEGFLNRILLVEPENLHAKTEMASLYAKMQRWPEREKILFEIYEAGTADIFVLAAIARTFNRFKKYRISLILLEEALKLRESDLLTIFDLIKTYVILHDKTSVKDYLKKSEEIIREDPYQKNVERFRHRLALLDLSFINEDLDLIALNEVGILVQADNQSFVENGGVRYPLKERAVVNYRLKHNDKVFFAIYSCNGQMSADFIEPYFDSINDLSSLK